MKCDRPGEYRPDSHCQQQSYRGLHSAGRSLSPRPTFNMSTEFEVSVIVRPFSLRGSIKCVCWGGGRGGGKREGGKGKWEITSQVPDTDVLWTASTAREV